MVTEVYPLLFARKGSTGKFRTSELTEILRSSSSSSGTDSSWFCNRIGGFGRLQWSWLENSTKTDSQVVTKSLKYRRGAVISTRYP